MKEELIGWCLRAFPRRFRSARHGELTATIDEALQAEGPSVTDWPLAFDLVRSGWAERWRSRPPLRRFIGYRFFGRPLPGQWHGWMKDDLQGWFGLRRNCWIFLPLSAILLSFGAPSSVWIGNAVGGVVISLIPHAADRNRRQILRQHGYSADGDLKHAQR